ncbi:hypothetical protein ADEAN_000254300 [Angomonas deanei]|uniref:Uncharacterized protein n=1 Tax=Angomonas deanei TaxID=59799 RepID=A0A7G2C5S0_9TRYP|nr:hypothetical protein ADEAN_000254300 [Angomonas deanei]
MDTFSLHNNNNNTTTPIKIVHSTEHYEKNTVLLQTILHQNESFIEKEVLQPVTACLTEYALLFTANPLHNNNNNETKNFAEGVPSAVIRTLGETIMEIPLRIETIFNQIQTNNMDEIISHFLENVIPLTLQQLVQTVLSITIRIMLVPKNSPNNAPKREGYMYIPEEEIDTDYLAGDTQTHNSKRRVVICQYYKRILNDLEYINNILSAVTDDSFDEVKNVCDALRAAMAEEDSNNNTNEIVLSVEADVKKYGKKENL